MHESSLTRLIAQNIPAALAHELCALPAVCSCSLKRDKQTIFTNFLRAVADAAQFHRFLTFDSDNPQQLI